MRLYARNGMWHADLRAHGRGRVSLSVPVTAPRRDAERAAAVLLTQAAAPKHTGPTLGQVYDRALRSHFANHKDRAGVDSRWRLAVEPFFGRDTEIAAVSSTRVADFKAHLIAHGDAPATINRKVALVSKLLHLGVEWGMLDRVPVIRREREEGGRVRWLSREEEAGVLAHLRGGGHTLMADLVVVLVDTGLRLGEALRLRPSDVQGGKAHVWVSKSGKPRTVPLTARAGAVLEALRAGLAAPGARYFAGLDHDRAGYLWDKARAHLGLANDPDFVIHALRHTFAVRMLEATGDLRVVQGLLGHASVTTTQRYAHVADGRLADAVRAMERANSAAAAPVLREVSKQASA
jgi:integrase